MTVKYPVGVGSQHDSSSFLFDRNARVSSRQMTKNVDMVTHRCHAPGAVMMKMIATEELITYVSESRDCVRRNSRL